MPESEPNGGLDFLQFVPPSVPPEVLRLRKGVPCPGSSPHDPPLTSSSPLLHSLHSRTGIPSAFFLDSSVESDDFFVSRYLFRDPTTAI